MRMHTHRHTHWVFWGFFLVKSSGLLLHVSYLTMTSLSALTGDMLRFHDLGPGLALYLEILKVFGGTGLVWLLSATGWADFDAIIEIAAAGAEGPLSGNLPATEQIHKKVLH